MREAKGERHTPWARTRHAASMLQTLPRATERHGGPSLPFLLRCLPVAVLGEIFARSPESAQRGGVPAVDRRVQQNLADLFLRHAVADGSVEMELQFL